jgi:flagellar basal-body rod protein FlgF
MENTLLVALSQQMALRQELDVVANNMANINTNGFRREAVQFQEFLMPVASADGFPPPDRRLSYVQDRATFHDFGKGALRATGSALDVAVEGDAFFTVQSADGQGELYTRNGAFQIDARGRLVTATGEPVLGTSGPITLDPDDTTIVIARDGTVSNKDGIRGRLRLSAFDNPQGLVKLGDSLFRAGPGQTPQAVPASEIRVAQGMLEGSNVRGVLEMARLIEINRAYANLATMIQRSDEIRKSAIDRLADIPA